MSGIGGGNNTAPIEPLLSSGVQQHQQQRQQPPSTASVGGGPAVASSASSGTGSVAIPPSTGSCNSTAISNAAASSSSSVTTTTAGGGTTAGAATTSQQQQDAATGSSGGTSTAAGATSSSSQLQQQQHTSSSSSFDPTDQAVLEYLYKKGLGSAALELQQILKQGQQKKQEHGEVGSSSGTDDTESYATKKNTGSDHDENEKKDDNSSGKDQSDVAGKKKTEEKDVETVNKTSNDDTTSKGGTTSATSTTTTNTRLIREKLEEEDSIQRNQRTLLKKSTGGSYGYDLDAAFIIQWGMPDTGKKTTTEDDNGEQQQESDNNKDKDGQQQQKAQGSIGIGVEEARGYLEAFTSIQLWVLSLPDHDDGTMQRIENPIRRAQKAMKRLQNKQQQQRMLSNNKKNKDDDDDDDNDDNDNNNEQDCEEEGNDTMTITQTLEPTLDNAKDILQELTDQKKRSVDDDNMDDDDDEDHMDDDDDDDDATSLLNTYNLPPSIKSELLAVTFALYVHTYCELLEVGMETTAHCIRDAYSTIYESIYPTEIQDLLRCTTTEDILKLNSYNSQHMEALAALKSILVQVASYQLRLEELNAQKAQLVQQQQQQSRGANSSNADSIQQQRIHQISTKILEYDQHIMNYKQKYTELSSRASAAFYKMNDLPFLRKARAVRWQLFMSITTYHVLSSYLYQNSNKHDTDSLLSMTTILQTKCELHVERRDPMPFVPSCVLLDEYDTAVVEKKKKQLQQQQQQQQQNNGSASGSANTSNNAARRVNSLLTKLSIPSIKKTLEVNKVQINWAAPCPRRNHEFLKLIQEEEEDIVNYAENEEQSRKRLKDKNNDGDAMDIDDDVDDNNKDLRKKKNSKKQRLPFPKLHLDDEYDTAEDAQLDKQRVEFNRSLLINGFRRLEALERKRAYECLSTTAKKKKKTNMLIKDDAAAGDSGGNEYDGRHRSGKFSLEKHAFQPSILMMALGSSNASSFSTSTNNDTNNVGRNNPSTTVRSSKSLKGSSSSSSSYTDVSMIWEEAGIGLCCAKICPPDGRRIAAGCDDSAIRVWDFMNSYELHGSRGNNNAGGGGEPTQVLLGHKNGFPVFDLDWNRDGRCLLSCGGDGSIRLWDTAALGPFGETATKISAATTKKSSTSSSSLQSNVVGPSTDPEKGADMTVPGSRTESYPATASGAALAVYRGHVPGSPVWSVSFSPAGYYFMSTGSDATARLWTTDRPVPVRLFTGHTSSNVNCSCWHPNCNYVMTGSDDMTCRLWDIHTGRTVRLLLGATAGINTVIISPDGRYAVGGDYNGVAHMWDLGNGKKMTEFRCNNSNINNTKTKINNSNNNTIGGSGAGTGSSSCCTAMIHSLCFSSCGSVLASGGDDCCIRLWDVRTDSLLRCSNSINAATTTMTNMNNAAATTRHQHHHHGVGGGGGGGRYVHSVLQPVKSYGTKRTLLMDLHFTKRNLLLAAGKVVTPVPSYSAQ